MKKILGILRRDFNLFKVVGLCFTDTRKRPQIPLIHIVIQCVLMPIFGFRNFLALDTASRLKSFKKLFKSERRMVSSDTTVMKILKNIFHKETERFLLKFLPVFEQKKVLEVRLTKGGRSHRIGIIDGSYMGGHWISCLTLAGKINHPVLFEPYSKRGKELPATHTLLKRIPQVLGASQPKLYLMDSLYFNEKIFKCIAHELNAYLIIKSRNPEFRDVLKEANLLMGITPDIFKEGYDGNRMCRYRIWETELEFASCPIQIIKVQEYYPKKMKEEANTEFFAVCTDMTMTAEEIRLAAHLRWEIENNVFKRLNEHCGTKNVRTSSAYVFMNWIRLTCFGLALFQLIEYMLKEDAEAFKKFLEGRKATWKNIRSVLYETLFNYLVFI